MPRRTPGEHFCHYPSPDGALPHARATLTPNSVAQRCRAARSGNISATIRHPTGHYHTLGRHFCPVPSPNSTTTHARATLTSNSVAQRCRGARSGNTSAPFRRPRVPRRTPGEHFCPFPSPNGAAPHARATPTPVSVAGEGGGRETDGDGREAGQGRSLGRGLGLGQGKGRGRAYIKEPRTS